MTIISWKAVQIEIPQIPEVRLYMQRGARTYGRVESISTDLMIISDSGWDEVFNLFASSLISASVRTAHVGDESEPRLPIHLLGTAHVTAIAKELVKQHAENACFFQSISGQ